MSQRDQQIVLCSTCSNPIDADAKRYWDDEDWEEIDSGNHYHECSECQWLDAQAENASLAFAESGGGSEMMNDMWAERVHGGW